LKSKILESSLIYGRFALATAIDEKAAILTGDPEFKKAEEVASIEWL